jgi:hypothetical protein
MKNKKNIVLIIGISLLVVFLASAGVVATLKQVIPLETTQPVKIEASSPVNADTLKSQAYAALKKAHPEQAKKLFEQARIQYKKNNNENAVAEIDGQLYLIDHTKSSIPTPAPVVVKTQ